MIKNTEVNPLKRIFAPSKDHPGRRRGAIMAILAAVFFSLEHPVAKVQLSEMGPAMVAAFISFGAGFGMLFIHGARRIARQPEPELSLDRHDIPWMLLIIALDAMAMVLAMYALSHADAATDSLLAHFEVVVTAFFGFLVFGEHLTRRLGAALGFIAVATVILTFEGGVAMEFHSLSLLVILSAILIGIANNMTRLLSHKNPVQIIIAKGLGAGAICVIFALNMGETITSWVVAGETMLLGFVSYGLSLFCYIVAQRFIGAVRTSAFFGIAPFLAAGISLILFRSVPSLQIIMALPFMALGTWILTHDSHAHEEPQNLGIDEYLEQTLVRVPRRHSEERGHVVVATHPSKKPETMHTTRQDAAKSRSGH